MNEVSTILQRQTASAHIQQSSVQNNSNENRQLTLIVITVNLELPVKSILNYSHGTAC